MTLYENITLRFALTHCVCTGHLWWTQTSLIFFEMQGIVVYGVHSYTSFYRKFWSCSIISFGHYPLCLSHLLEQCAA